MTSPAVIFLVRHRLSHARHLERYGEWCLRRDEALKVALADLSGVRRYHFEKDPLFLHTFYDFAGGALGSGLDAACGSIRAAWGEFASSMRELTGVAYELRWHRSSAADEVSAPPSGRPLIVERFAFTPYGADREADWAAWYDDEMLPEMVADLPVLAIARYRAVVGSPRYQLKVNEYADEATLSGSVAKEEGSGPRAGGGAREKFRDGWAPFLPHADDLTRWVLLPDQ